jgi:hypothetical protein
MWNAVNLFTLELRVPGYMMVVAKSNTDSAWRLWSITTIKSQSQTHRKADSDHSQAGRPRHLIWGWMFHTSKWRADHDYISNSVANHVSQKCDALDTRNPCSLTLPLERCRLPSPKEWGFGGLLTGQFEMDWEMRRYQCT